MIPVATASQDLVVAHDLGGFDLRATPLVPLDSTWPELEGVDVSAELGIVGLDVRACVGGGTNTCHDLEGARLRIEPASGGAGTAVGDGPYYGRGGRYDLSADRTSADTPPLLPGQTHRPRNVLVNVPEGEYRFIVEHDRVRCWAQGRVGGNPVFGFPTTDRNTVRFPVLPGHVTPFVSQRCDCLVDPALGLPSPATCEVPDARAAAP